MEELPYPCPGKNGDKCIEITPPIIRTTMCSGCLRNTLRVPEKLLEERMLAKEQKEASINLKQAVYAQLKKDLENSAINLRGITIVLEISRAIGVDREEFLAFHKLVVKASRQGELAKLFDFVDEDGRTFVAIEAHTARFQTYLDEEDLPDQKRELSLTNPIVSKIYKDMVKLQKILTTELYPIKGVRERIPAPLPKIVTKWGPPIVLFSKGSKEKVTRSMPKSAFANQALHCDFKPGKAKSNAKLRGKPVPFSMIIHCSPKDAVIIGCGMSPLEVIDMSRYTREPCYDDLPDPIPISIPTGCMVIFRGDYVHGGSAYANHHTRLFMGLQVTEDIGAFNTTFLEDAVKHPPKDIKGEAVARGSRDKH